MAWYMVLPGEVWNGIYDVAWRDYMVYGMVKRTWFCIWYGLADTAWYMAWSGGHGMVYDMAWRCFAWYMI